MSRARDDALITAFAHVLRQLRTARGLTQEQLAFDAEIDRTFVGLLETAKRQPTLSVLFALAQALNAKPEKLVADVRAYRNQLLEAE